MKAAFSMPQSCHCYMTTRTLSACAHKPHHPQVDGNDQKTPGWRYNYWELKGVPVRVEVGPRDVESGTCVMARRDVPGEAGLMGGHAASLSADAGTEELQALIMLSAVCRPQACAAGLC